MNRRVCGDSVQFETLFWNTANQWCTERIALGFAIVLCKYVRLEEDATLLVMTILDTAYFFFDSHIVRWNVYAKYERQTRGSNIASGQLPLLHLFELDPPP